jgi:hypothetical protein
MVENSQPRGQVLSYPNIKKNWGNDQEIEFQDIEIGIFQEIKTFYKIDQEFETYILLN